MNNLTNWKISLTCRLVLHINFTQFTKQTPDISKKNKDPLCCRHRVEQFSSQLVTGILKSQQFENICFSRGIQAPGPSGPATDLLASLMSAMAMRSRFLRKMSSRMMMSSTMARMITAQNRKRREIKTTTGCLCVCACARVASTLTESQPGLPDLQVDGEVGLQAQVSDGDVGARLTLQAGVLHVAVENPCVKYLEMIKSKWGPF